MEKPIICVFDQKAGTFNNPFYADSKGVALREFADVVNRPDENSLIYKHPEDFDLYLLGTWDPQAGSMVLLDQKEHLMNGRTMRTDA
jgi:hypothetical protein